MVKNVVFREIGVDELAFQEHFAHHEKKLGVEVWYERFRDLSVLKPW